MTAEGKMYATGRGPIQYKLYFSMAINKIKMGTGEQAPCFPGNCSTTDLYPQPRNCMC